MAIVDTLSSRMNVLTPPTSPPPFEHETPLTPLMFDDGNVTLMTYGGIVKVHIGVLCRLTSSFQHIWDGRPNKERNTVSVYLTDTKNEIILFTNALYNINSPQCHIRPIDIGVLGILLRLSKKYVSPELRANLTDRVHFEFPKTLEQWVRAEEFRGSHIATENGKLFALVHIARHAGIETSLPALFYRISATYTNEEIREGTVDEDGTRWTLTTDDQLNCLVGKGTLTDAQGDACMSWVVPGKVDWRTCEEKRKCAEYRDKLYRRVWGPCKYLSALDEWDDAWDAKLCSECRAIAREIHNAGRLRIWKSLPLHFNLQEWTVLERQENEKILQVEPFDFDYMAEVPGNH